MFSGILSAWSSILRSYCFNFMHRYGQSQWRKLATLNESVSAVLDFWFKPGESMQAKYELWFSGSSEVDDTISKRFGDLVSNQLHI